MLKNAIEEIREACPDIQHIFVFNKAKHIEAASIETPEKVINPVIEAFKTILERAEALGGVKTVTMKYANGTATLYSFNHHHLFMVTEEKADMNYVNTITRVLIPAVLRIAEKLGPTPLTEDELPISNIEEKPQKQTPENADIMAPEEKVPMETEPKQETMFVQPQAIQLMVENIEGLRSFFIPSDAVRIGSEIFTEWENTFHNRIVENVIIETFNGKTAKCKVKPIKDPSYNGKGIVQIPNRIQLALEINKGDLVKVKPVIE